MRRPQTQPQQQQPQIIPMPQQSGVVQVPVGRRQEAPSKPQIIVKQTVKQVQGKEKPKRRKTGITKTRKEYNALKKQVKARIKEQKDAAYEKQNARISKLPKKKQTALRRKLKKGLKDKHSRLVKQLKAGSSYKSVDALHSAISLAKSLKW